MKNRYPTGALNEKLARLLVFQISNRRTKQYIRKCRLSIITINNIVIASLSLIIFCLFPITCPVTGK